MTAKQYVDGVYKSYYRQGIFITKDIAKDIAAKQILEGFNNLEEAEKYYEIFKDREMVFYDVYGVMVTPKMLKWAIDFIKKEWHGDFDYVVKLKFLK